MVNLFGPGAFGAARPAVVRPAFTPANGAGDPDDWYKDCTSQEARDGTEFKSSWLNGILANLRSLVRKSGTIASNLDDDLLTRALRRGFAYAGVAGGTANDITVALDPAPVAGEIGAGFSLRIKIASTNTGAMTFNGAALQNFDGSALVAGDLIASNFAGLTYDGAAWRVISGAPAATRAAVSLALNNFVVIADQKANGLNGGDFLAGAWRTRDLNTIVADPNNLVGAGLVTLAANRITLGAGIWVVEASAPAVAVNSHKTRLQNITDGATAVWGSTEQTTQNTNSDQIATRSQLTGRIVLAAAKTFELQHICEQSSTGFAAGVGFGMGSVYIGGAVPEVYSMVQIRKVG